MLTLGVRTTGTPLTLGEGASPRTTSRPAAAARRSPDEEDRRNRPRARLQRRDGSRGDGMKPISRSLLCLMVLFGATTAARAGQLSTRWVAQAGYPGTPSKVVTDAAGNVYVTGSTYSAD